MYMRLEKQVCSLELAKRLKDMGVKQDSYFFWRTFPDGSAGLRTGEQQSFDFAAFTVAELGELIGPYFQINSGRSGRPAIMVWAEALPNILVRSNPDLHPPEEVKRAPLMSADTEADARAEILVYLIKNALLDPLTLAHAGTSEISENLR